MGKLLKGVVKFTAAAAAVGGICYIFRDQIKESKVYKEYDVDGKINKVKTTLKEKMPKIFDNEEDYVDENEIFFDDLDLTAEDVERDYVSIDTEEVADAAKESAEEVKEAVEEVSTDIPTIEV